MSFFNAPGIRVNPSGSLVVPRGLSYPGPLVGAEVSPIKFGVLVDGKDSVRNLLGSAACALGGAGAQPVDALATCTQYDGLPGVMQVQATENTASEIMTQLTPLSEDGFAAMWNAFQQGTMGTIRDSIDLPKGGSRRARNTVSLEATLDKRSPSVLNVALRSRSHALGFSIRRASLLGEQPQDTLSPHLITQLWHRATGNSPEHDHLRNIGLVGRPMSGMRLRLHLFARSRKVFPFPRMGLILEDVTRGLIHEGFKGKGIEPDDAVQESAGSIAELMLKAGSKVGRKAVRAAETAVGNVVFEADGTKVNTKLAFELGALGRGKQHHLYIAPHAIGGDDALMTWNYEIGLLSQPRAFMDGTFIFVDTDSPENRAVVVNPKIEHALMTQVEGALSSFNLERVPG